MFQVIALCVVVFLQANNMSLEEKVSDNALRFVLIGKSPSSTVKLTCQAPSDEVKQNWVGQIRSILDMQGDIIKGIFVLCVVFPSTIVIAFGVNC